jgi:hypothetical protein
VNYEQQLERIAKLPIEERVGVYSLQSPKGIEVWLWLCGACLEAKKAEGWTYREERPAPQTLPCQECAS